jgi:hypothetical protein
LGRELMRAVCCITDIWAPSIGHILFLPSTKRAEVATLVGATNLGPPPPQSENGCNGARSSRRGSSAPLRPYIDSSGSTRAARWLSEPWEDGVPPPLNSRCPVVWTVMRESKGSLGLIGHLHSLIAVGRQLGNPEFVIKPP